MKKYFVLILTLLFVIFIASCDVFEELFGSKEDNNSGSLVGNWREDNAVISLVLTTYTNQTATNFLNSTGELTVTGGYQTKLPLLIEIPEDEAEEIPAMLVAVDPTSALNDTVYILNLDASMQTTQGFFQVSTLDESEYYDELGGEVNFTYNGTALNVNNSTLASDDTQLSVNINGSITYEQVSITAGQPTTLSFNASQFYDFGNTITTFYEDSTFLSSEDQGIGDSTGTWAIIGDTLALTTTTEVEDLNGNITLVDTTVYLGYVNNGNSFTVSQSMDICETIVENDDDISCDDIYAIIEQFFQLDEGSIQKAELIFQLIFERVSDGQVVKEVRQRPKRNWRTYIPDQFKAVLPEL